MKMIVSLGNYSHKCDAARKVLSSLNVQFSMFNVCLSDAHCERCERENTNFPYRNTFTPRLNAISLYESYISISHISHTRKRRHSQVCHFRLVNDTLRLRK